MSRMENIKARLPDGSLRDIQIRVSEDAPWKLEFQGLDGTMRCIEAGDLFEALRKMRGEFENAGCLLLCAGSRPDINPSGMSRSMGGGRRAYILHRGQQATMSETVDIFDYAEPAVVGTTRQQLEYVQGWIESLKL